MNSKPLIASLVLGTLILTAGTAMARPGNYNNNYVEITAEQEAQIVKMSTAYQKSVSPLIEELNAKKMEFYAISNHPEAKMKDIEALSKEIAALNTEIRDENIAFHEDVSKKTGLSMGGGMHGGGMHGGGMGSCGMGYGGMGHGGMGHGGMGRGHNGYDGNMNNRGM